MDRKMARLPFSMNTCTEGERIKILKPLLYSLVNCTKTTQESDFSQSATFIHFINESFKNCKKSSSVNGLVNTAQIDNVIHEQSYIFDCGSTNTMTNDLSDFSTTTKPINSYIHTVNGEKLYVKSGGTIFTIRKF